MNPRRTASRAFAVEPRRSAGGISRRAVLIGTAVGIPTSAVFLLLSLRHLDADALRASVRSADPFRLAVAGGVMWLVYLAQAVRWRVIADDARRLPVARYLEWVVGAIAVNNVVPGRPGELLRVEWLARATGFARARALGSVAIDRVSDVLALLVALAMTYPAVQHPAWLHRLGLVGAAAGIVLVAFLAGAYTVARRTGTSAGGRLRRLVTDLAGGIGGGLRGRRGAYVGLLSLFAWAAWALSAWLVASALHVSLSPYEIVFVTAVLNLGVALPSSPGFIGTYQWLSVSALGVVGVGHSEAFAFSVLLHAVWFFPTTLAGAGLALQKLRPAIAPVLAFPSSERRAA